MFLDGAVDEKNNPIAIMVSRRRRSFGGRMKALEEVVRKTFSLDAQTALTDQDGPGTVIGWDSLGHMTLLAAVQSRFGLRFDVKDILRIEKLGDIRSVLRQKGVAEENGN